MLSFKKFFEDYTDGLDDELGISWDDILNIYDDNGNGQLSRDSNTFLRIGKELFKSGTYEIVPGTLSKNGASIIIKNKSKSYFPGDKASDGSLDGKIYHLDKQQLFNLITRGWMPY
jgi:hypothetical protein